MTYEIYRYIFMGSAALAGIMLAVSIALFFYFKIPNVIGDLTGSNARKAIEEIRIQNENSGHKTYKSSLVNQNRGKLTEKISPSGQLIKHEVSGSAMATEKISTQQLTPMETTVLDAQIMSAGETIVLSESVDKPENVFEIEFEITYIHTNEVITI